ncbi:MAG TPA: gamma-glutamyltransferase [Stellaceae bacterium]|nr:gamma-glutamyltransferase [Stellaceae bacterium]
MSRILGTVLSLGLLAIIPTRALAISEPPVKAAHGMVVSSQHLASEVGVEILQAGGNAVDAAVAVGYALAVVNPCCGNIGGGGFMTLHLADGRDVFLNFRETAPGAATETMYLDAAGNVVPKLSLQGYLAVGVPGTVLGLDTALRRYGTMPRTAVMAPAIRLARDGFVLAPGDVDILATATADFAQQPNVAAAFLHDGERFRPGERQVQTDLAQTLDLIARQGPDAFYKGPIADAIVAASQAHGGILSKADFEAYTVTETAPIRCSYRGYDFITAPPPSSGGTTMCEIMNILEGYPMSELGFHSAQGVHLMVEAMRHAYVDRNTYLGDPAFVRNPLDRLLSKGYADEIRAKIDPARATASRDVAPGTPPHEGTDTTHYSIVDQAGNAVSVTYTVNALFGAKVIAGNTGFFLNDEMDDFTVKPGVPNLFGLVQGKANSIAPGKRPLSSMSPTVVTKDGHTVMVVGSPGGSRIITITLETVLNVIDYGMTIQEAVDAPRIHHQWLPDTIAVERFALSADTRRALEAMGYTITEQTPWGAAEAILIGDTTGSKPAETATSGNDAMLGGAAQPGMLYGANDNRRPAGKAVGY